MLNLNQVILPALQDGKHNVSLLSYQDTSDDKGDRLLLTFKFEDREFKQTVFASNLNYWLTGIRAQLGLADKPMTIAEILTTAINKPLNVWVSRNDYGINLALYEPKPKTPVITEIAREDMLL